MRKINMIFMTIITTFTFSNEIASDEKNNLENINVSTPNNIGLVLSGGSAKGMTHIGVLKVLEEEKVPIEYISGTSAGAIIGGLYSIGYSPDEIKEMVSNIDWIAMFTDKVSRVEKGAIDNYYNETNAVVLPLEKFVPKIPDGVVGGYNISNQLSDMFYGVEHVRDFESLPVKFSAVATDLNTGEAVVLNEGSLPLAIRGSMSIPTLLSPVKYKDHLLVDGGIVRNLPVQDVKVMGADYTIGVNVGEGFTKIDEDKLNLFKVMADVSTIEGKKETQRQARMLDIYLEPDLSDYDSANFEKIEEFISIGEKIARENIDQIRKLSNPKKYEELQQKKREFKLSWNNEYKINNLVINGNKKFSDKYFNNFFYDLPKSYTKEELKTILDNIFAEQNFSYINYEIIDSSLVLNVKEKATNYLTLNGNINSEDYATVLVGAQGKTTFNDKDLRYELEGKINEEYNYRGNLALSLGRKNKGIISLDTKIEKDIIKNQEGSIDEFDNRVSNIILSIGNEINKNFYLGLGAGFEETLTGKTSYNEEERLHYPVYTAKILYDTRDSKDFATEGNYLSSTYLMSNQWDADFNTLYSSLESNMKINDKITIRPSFEYISTDGEQIPETYKPKLGGFKSRNYSLGLGGIKENSVRSNTIWNAGLGIQYNFTDYIYGHLDYIHSGLTNKHFSFESDENYNSYGLTLGVKTPMGPIYGKILKTEGEHERYYLNMGYEIKN